MTLTGLKRGWRQNPAIQGLGVCSGLLAGLLVWELANDHSAGLAAIFVDGTRPGTMLILTLLTGFVWGASHHAGSAFRRDLALLIPQLRASADERDAMIQRYEQSAGTRSRVAGAIGSCLGVLVIAEDGGITPWLFSNQAWHHGFVAGIAVNGLLFWLMGRGAYHLIQSSRLIAGLSPMMPPVDLLDLRSYTPFARHGLRTAFVWLGGSSLASLIYLNQNQALMTALVIVVTVGLGIYSLFQPLRGARKTIVHAKERELERIREAIRACRGELLDGRLDASSNAARRIPGLLAYEARIASVREWPLDLPTFMRFALLVTLAVGSWLGGAVVELLLGSALGN